MKLYRQRDLKRCGIYLIRNKVNNKVYIGKSINIYERIRQHINYLNKKSKNENLHLIYSWHKYKRESFEYEVLEDVELNDKKLNERELYWMIKYNSLNRYSGYNLRYDSRTKCILSKETRKRMSESKIKLYSDHNYKSPKLNSTFWKDNPEITKQMANKLKLIKRKYKFEQYTRDMVLIKIWDSVEDIINVNPEYKWQNVYAVCNNYKPTYMNFIWRKIKI